MSAAAIQWNLEQQEIPPAPATETVIAETVCACQRRYGSRLQALILTGSLAREEGTTLVVDGVCRILGDAEFLLIFRRHLSRNALSDLPRLAGSISGALCQHGIACKVDLAAATPRYLRQLPRQIFSYELRHAGRVVWGDAGSLQLAPEFPAAQLDREDAWRLLSNRMVEWLEALARVPNDAPGPGLDLFYSTVKLWMDAATSLLVFLGGYEPSYRARAMRLVSLLAELPRALPFSQADFSSGVVAATRWKLAPEPPMAQRAGWEFCSRARRLAAELWCWELGQLSGLNPADTPFGLVRAWSRCGSASARCRAWLRLAREQGWLRSHSDWPHWMRLARDGPPRHWIYGVAAECMMRVDDFSVIAREGAASPLRMEALRRRLPLPHAPLPTNGSQWRALACDLAWNYRRFVAKTRT
jgi:hypothetical protein